MLLSAGNGVDNKQLIDVNEIIRFHPIEMIGYELRDSMTAMKKSYNMVRPNIEGALRAQSRLDGVSVTNALSVFRTLLKTASSRGFHQTRRLTTSTFFQNTGGLQ